MTIHDPDLEPMPKAAIRCSATRRPRSSSTSCASGCCGYTRQAIEDFAMARPGERWLVALSGGKDSYGLLAMLLDLKWRGLLPVDLLACNLDQGQPNFPKHILPDYPRHGTASPHRIEYQDTYSVVTDKLPEGSTYCSLCSRLQARPSLPHRARGGLLGAGARPPSRGHPRNLLHEPVPWRPARRHAAKAAQRRGRRHGAAAAEPIAPRRTWKNSPPACSSRSSRAISAAARKGCSATP